MQNFVNDNLPYLNTYFENTDEDILNDMERKIKANSKGKKYRKPPLIEEKEKLLLYRGSLNSKYAGKHFLYEGNEKELCLMKIS